MEPHGQARACTPGSVPARRRGFLRRRDEVEVPKGEARKLEGPLFEAIQTQRNLFPE